MNRQQRVEQLQLAVLGLRKDTDAEKQSALMVAQITATLNPDMYDRYVTEVQDVAVVDHVKSRGFRKLHDALREGALRLLQEEVPQ
jgi:hypothetical protein